MTPTSDDDAVVPAPPAAEAYLVGLRLAGRRVVVLGDGPGCVRRVRELTPTGAELVVICSDPAAADAIDALGTVNVERRGWRPGDLAGARLAAICLDTERDGPLAEARSEGALVYVPDVPDESDLILAAMVRRGPVRIAISTGGASPAGARRFAERLDAGLPVTAAAAVAALAAARRHLRATGAPLPGYAAWADVFDAAWEAPDPAAAWAEVAARMGIGLAPPCSFACGPEAQS